MNGEGRVSITGRNNVSKKRDKQHTHTQKQHKVDKGKMEGKEQATQEVFLQFKLYVS